MGGKVIRGKGSIKLKKMQKGKANTKTSKKDGYSKTSTKDEDVNRIVNTHLLTLTNREEMDLADVQSANVSIGILCQCC